jgi:hypothetical protein
MTDAPENTADNREFSPEYKAHIWKPGQTGNAGGRPKRKPLTDALRAALDEPVTEEIRRKLNLKAGTTYAEVLALSLVREALKGKVPAFSEIADRVEGKPDNRTELSGEVSLADATDPKELTTEQLKAIILTRRRNSDGNGSILNSAG